MSTEELLAKFESDFEELIRKAREAGLDIDDLMTLVDGVIEGED